MAVDAGSDGDAGGEMAEETDAESGSPDAEDADGPMPPFLRYGVFTVGFYGLAVAVLHFVARVDVDGPSLATFTAGFLVFMTFYFGAMWVGWLYLR